MSSSASLRDLYTPPSDAWSFTPAQASNATAQNVPPPSSYQWSTRTHSNPLLDLSASISGDDEGMDIKLLLQGLLYSAMLRFSASVVTVPWDIGKTLLQVQWVPRDAGEVVPGTVLITDESDEEDLSDTSIDNDDSYFADPNNSDAGPRRDVPHLLSDEKGYVVRQSVLEEGTLPEYVIPVGSASGVWGMMKRLGRFRPEGWLSLWKGLLTSAIMDAIAIGLQPTILSLLEAIFSSDSPSPDSLHSLSAYALPVASQILTGFLVSPLDLVRTRLMVQTSIPRHRAYSGPIDAFRQILTQEGGLHGIYLHPHLLIPTLLDCSLRSVIPIVMPRVVASYLSFGGAPITAETHPFMWGLCEWMGGSTGYLVTIPFETVRHRLQVQVRGTAKPLKACVELRPAPYNGVVDAMWHIVTEERSDLPLKPRKRRRKSMSAKGKASAGKPAEEERVEDAAEPGSWMRNTGLGQLYRGLGMRHAQNINIYTLVRKLFIAATGK
ncbi:hypothetical protein EUX98_g4452 [Antrodiella citrinella]|uniref:Mitochondrial carrier n=1 Tax=Antrodiella citrinella TaxID=2447956 RepID=A0A4S4MTX7_9APHY|nr:hypothetical protein EUX98_g4452 [Antrodiella citrinella]